METLPGMRSMTSRDEKLSPTSPKRSVGMEMIAVEGDDADRFLAAMLKGVQAQDRMGGRFGFRPAMNAEKPAFVVKAISSGAGRDLGVPPDIGS